MLQAKNSECIFLKGKFRLHLILFPRVHLEMGHHWLSYSLTSGPIFCLLLGVRSDYAQPITVQVTEVTCPVIGWAQPELTPIPRKKKCPVWRHHVVTFHALRLKKYLLSFFKMMNSNQIWIFYGSSDPTMSFHLLSPFNSSSSLLFPFGLLWKNNIEPHYISSLDDSTVIFMILERHVTFGWINLI